MLPPLIPLSAAPVTSQQDPVRPTPDIPPVTAAQASASDNNINTGQRNPEEAQVLLREEQRRQQRRRSDRRVVDRHGDPEEQTPAMSGDFLNADNTVPVVPIIDDEPRQGVWVDLKV